MEIRFQTGGEALPDENGHPARGPDVETKLTFLCRDRGSKHGWLRLNHVTRLTLLHCRLLLSLDLLKFGGFTNHGSLDDSDGGLQKKNGD